MAASYICQPKLQSFLLAILFLEYVPDKCSLQAKVPTALDLKYVKRCKRSLGHKFEQLTIYMEQETGYL
jgi:hypothetical protein